MTHSYMKEKTDFLYVGGCSYTYGIGISPVNERSSLCWGGLLGEDLGLKTYNDASPGSSNDRIFRKATAHMLCNDTRPALAIIMWSDPYRQEFYRPSDVEYDWQDMVQVTPQGVGSIRSLYHRDAMEQFYAFINTPERAVAHLLPKMMAMQTLCDALDIPLIQFHYKPLFFDYQQIIQKQAERHPNDNPTVQLWKHVVDMRVKLREMSPHIFGVNDRTSFGQFMKDYNIPQSQTSLGHPGVEGHAFMADWFENYVSSNEDISKRL